VKKYYSLEVKEKEADIYIFGDITSWEWLESDVSSYTLSQELKGLDVDTINVHINSYGGEVAEGLAIYNMLKNHSAKVKTFCEGFACSVASVIFMAGDERIMNNASLLMIHNVWMCTAGNADQLRKDADDLEIINQASVNAYLEKINITEAELKSLLDAETWLLPDEALEKGFATSLIAQEEINKAAASAHKALFNLVKTATRAPVMFETKLPEINIDVDLIAEKLFAKSKAELERKPSAQDPAKPDSAEPLSNKTMKLLNALMGGKD
jgi:ATP-dependent Clp protease protease subunit